MCPTPINSLTNGSVLGKGQGIVVSVGGKLFCIGLLIGQILFLADAYAQDVYECEHTPQDTGITQMLVHININDRLVGHDNFVSNVGNLHIVSPTLFKPYNIRSSGELILRRIVTRKNEASEMDFVLEGLGRIFDYQIYIPKFVLGERTERFIAHLYYQGTAMPREKEVRLVCESFHL